MSKLLKNSAILLVGAILVVALAAVLGLLLNNSSSTGAAQAPANANPQAPSVSAPSQPRAYPAMDEQTVDQVTQKWRVYENQKFGFRVKYPPNFLIVETERQGIRLLDIDLGDEKWRNAQGGTQGMGIVVYSNPKQLGVEQWFKQNSGRTTEGNLPDNSEFVDPTNAEMVNVRNQTALKFVDGGMIQLPSVLIARGSVILRFWYGPGVDNLEPPFELMLATLKFTK